MTEQTPTLKSPPRYRTAPGYAYKRPESGRWADAETVVLPQCAEGCTNVYGFVTIDGARCAVFQTPVGRFAQTLVATQEPERDMVPVEFLGAEETGGDVAVTWATEAVATGGPSAGRVVRSLHTAYLPREVFAAATARWQEQKGGVTP